MSGSPRIFRILLAAKDLPAARRFYETLLGTPGRQVAPGRIYFDCGTVLLGILDYSDPEAGPITLPTESVYFATESIDELHRRATKLGCLAPGLLHDDPNSPLGDVVVRPWGERSFYATDPTGNSLCFVAAETIFTGSPAQIDALRGAMGRGT